MTIVGHRTFESPTLGAPESDLSIKVAVHRRVICIQMTFGGCSSGLPIGCLHSMSVLISGSTVIRESSMFCQNLNRSTKSMIFKVATIQNYNV